MISDQEHTVEVLNQLYSAEMQSVLARFAELDVFISSATAGQYELVKRVMAEDAEHRAWLIDAIERSDGSVWPVSLDPQTANLHYVSLQSIMPLVVRSVEKLVSAYADAAGEKPLTPQAVELIARIGRRHQAHLRALQTAHSPTSST